MIRNAKLCFLVQAVGLLACQVSPSGSKPASLEPPNWEVVDEVLADPNVPSAQPSRGFVPDEQTAIRIAEAVAIGLYGEEQTSEGRPYWARLKGDTWTVVGAHDRSSYGGDVLIELSRSDGRILFAALGQ